MFFSRSELVLAVSALFHDQVLFFSRKINISFIMLVVFQFRSFRETFIDFSNNIFSIETGITNLLHSIFRKINISFTVLVVFQSRRFRETFIDFSNSIFSIETGITNLFHYIWRISLIHKILNFTVRLEIRWRHQKKSRDLYNYFGIFWKVLCSTALMQSSIARA